MSLETIPGSAFQYGLISYDKKGRERDNGGAAELARVAAQNPTDIFFFCHGWKGDVPAAKDQYNRWMGALMRSTDLARAPSAFPGFKPLLTGLHWPSQPFGEEDTGAAAASFGPGVPPGASADAIVQQFVAALGDDAPIVDALRIIIEGARQNAGATELPAPDGVFA